MVGAYIRSTVLAVAISALLLLALGYVSGLWAMIFAPPLAALIQVLHASILMAGRHQEAA